MFYRVMKGIYQFAANLLSYIPTKYYRNRSTSTNYCEKKKGELFLKHSVEWTTVSKPVSHKLTLKNTQCKQTYCSILTHGRLM